MLFRLNPFILTFTLVVTASALPDSPQKPVSESRCIFVEQFSKYGIDLTIRNKSTTETGGIAKGLEDNLTPCGITGISPYRLFGSSVDYQVSLEVKNSTDALTCVQNAIWAAEKQHVLCVQPGLTTPGFTQCALIESQEAHQDFGQNITSNQYLAIVQIHTNQVFGGGGATTSTPGVALGKSLVPCGVVGGFNPQLSSSTDYYAEFTVGLNATTCIQNAVLAAENQNVTCSK